MAILESHPAERRTQRLVQAIQDLSAARDMASIRDIVRHAARDLVGSDGATVVLRDKDQCHYVDEDAIAPLWKGKRFPMATCISGWVMLNGKPAVIEDIYSDARIPHEAYRPTFVKSLAMVPIRPGDPLGAIGNYWARPHVPSPAEVEALQALANTTAVAMENVRILEELEARVQDRTSALLLANKELEAFTHAASHDLRTPLRGISGSVALLQARHGKALPPEARQLVDQIGGAVSRMGALLESLLRLSAANSPLRPIVTNMVELAREVAQEVRREHPDRPIRIEVADDLPLCVVDSTLLRQVLQNLLSNAVKFSATAAQAHIRVGGKESAEQRVYFVSDNGVGFESSQANALFQPFQTLHDRGQFQGSGIGLTIVQRIVERHGGRVWAESEPGRGATFYFSVPGSLSAA